MKLLIGGIMILLGVGLIAFPAVFRSIYKWWYGIWGFSVRDGGPMDGKAIYAVAGAVFVGVGVWCACYLA